MKTIYIKFLAGGLCVICVASLLFNYEYATLLFRKHLKKTPQKDPLSIESEINQTITDLETFIDSSMIGWLNYDIWHWLTGYLVDDLRISKDFPAFPDERRTASRLYSVFDEVDKADIKGRYGHKMYGYLNLPESGIYSFKVELYELSAAVSVELWISENSDPVKMKQILTLVHQKYNSIWRQKMKNKVSSDVNCSSPGPRYFEFLEKAFQGRVIAEVKWKIPSSSVYVPIPDSNIAMAVNYSDSSAIENLQSFHSSLPSNHLQTHHPVFSEIPSNANLDVLPSCSFTSLHAYAREVKKYKGVWQVIESKVAPRDETWFKKGQKNDRGNPTIDKSVVDKVVSLYTAALKASKIKGDVMRLHHLEETTNKDRGSRFLLEMEVQLHHPEKKVITTSEYVYLEKDSSKLCHTSNFQWKKNDEVYFVIAVKNLGLWVKHLIYNMEDIYEHTHDEHFSLIIVDYESQDMDIAEEAKKSLFKRIQVIHLKGLFSRSGGLQAGINSVEDPNSIVMTIDMHLTLPHGIVEYIRKHTVQYKMAFTPMFFRLNEGYTEINCNGFWETLTYGLFAMYKSDWSKFGGFDTRSYKTKWGGEDWDILDRSLAKGFEAFRIRPPGLVHYHHTRTGMWGNKDVKITKKWTLN